MISFLPPQKKTASKLLRLPTLTQGEIEDDEPIATFCRVKIFILTAMCIILPIHLLKPAKPKHRCSFSYLFWSLCPQRKASFSMPKTQKVFLTHFYKQASCSEDFYAIEDARLSKLLNIINDPERAKELGIIRSQPKAAVANYADEARRINIVSVENTGRIEPKKQKMSLW